MSDITVIVPGNTVRSWHLKIASRLAVCGHDITITRGTGEKNNYLLTVLLLLESHLFPLGNDNCIRPESPDPAVFTISEKPAPDTIIIDLTGRATNLPDNALQLLIDGQKSFSGLAASIAAGQLPGLAIFQKGKMIAKASPMIDNRVSVGRGLEDVLARAVSFTVTTMLKVLANRLEPVNSKNKTIISPESSFFPAWISNTLPQLGREILRRKKYRSAHWRVGYRFIDGDGVADTGDLSGEAWSVLPDNGTRFFADPFAFIKDDRAFIFVEDWCHTKRKAVISVSRIDKNGVAGQPQPIIEEPWHLSYPQIFLHDGNIWMIPESCGARNLVLYHAARFPDKWVKHTVLIENRDLSDATLIEHQGTFWLFATDGDESGSKSDMLVVFHASQLEGPWSAHEANPISIDRAHARPGGAFIKASGKTLLPMQDGSLGYGGGLGLSSLEVLDNRTVRLSPPVAIKNRSNWQYPQIHTLNRSGRLEVIDGLARVRK